MSAYRDDLEAARRRIAALEDDIACRDELIASHRAELARRERRLRDEARAARWPQQRRTAIGVFVAVSCGCLAALGFVRGTAPPALGAAQALDSTPPAGAALFAGVFDHAPTELELAHDIRSMPRGARVLDFDHCVHPVVDLPGAPGAKMLACPERTLFEDGTLVGQRLFYPTHVPDAHSEAAPMSEGALQVYEGKQTLSFTEPVFAVGFAARAAFNPRSRDSFETKVALAVMGHAGEIGRVDYDFEPATLERNPSPRFVGVVAPRGESIRSLTLRVSSPIFIDSLAIYPPPR